MSKLVAQFTTRPFSVGGHEGYYPSLVSKGTVADEDFLSEVIARAGLNYTPEELLHVFRAVAKYGPILAAEDGRSRMVTGFIEFRLLLKGGMESPDAPWDKAKNKCIVAAKLRWDVRWQGAGGRLYHGRMVAIKDDPIWIKISAFGNPFPPFDFGSGMGVRNISRKEALELGVLTETDIERGVKHREAMMDAGTHPSLNGHLEASINMRHDSPEAQALMETFGDQIQILGNKAVWQGNLIQDVLSGTVQSAHLGKASPCLLSQIKAKDPNQYDAFAAMDPTISKHSFDDHLHKHYGDNEKHGNSIPLTAADYELLPSLWRKPDSVEPSRGKLILSMNTFDGHTLRMVVSPYKGLRSFYKEKSEGSRQ